MKVFSFTAKGLRKTNEDYIKSEILSDSISLHIVADGMGGHKAGDFASKYTVEVFLDAVIHSKEHNMISIMNEAVDIANRALIKKAEEIPEYGGMGTTLVVATIQNRTILIANIGDSRLYIINDELRQITRDHSLVQEMVSLGELDKQDAKNHENKNIITRAIGADLNLVPDFFEIELESEDYILICSDGLTNMMDDDEIKMIIQQECSLEEKAKRLIDVANNNGGKDNIAVVLVKPNFDEVNLC